MTKTSLQNVGFDVHDDSPELDVQYQTSFSSLVSKTEEMDKKGSEIKIQEITNDDNVHEDESDQVSEVEDIEELDCNDGEIFDGEEHILDDESDWTPEDLMIKHSAAIDLKQWMEEKRREKWLSDQEKLISKATSNLSNQDNSEFKCIKSSVVDADDVIPKSDSVLPAYGELEDDMIEDRNYNPIQENHFEDLSEEDGWFLDSKDQNDSKKNGDNIPFKRGSNAEKRVCSQQETNMPENETNGHNKRRKLNPLDATEGLSSTPASKAEKKLHEREEKLQNHINHVRDKIKQKLYDNQIKYNRKKITKEGITLNLKNLQEKFEILKRNILSSGIQNFGSIDQTVEQIEEQNYLLQLIEKGNNYDDHKIIPAKKNSNVSKKSKKSQPSTSRTKDLDDFIDDTDYGDEDELIKQNPQILNEIMEKPRKKKEKGKPKSREDIEKMVNTAVSYACLNKPEFETMQGLEQLYKRFKEMQIKKCENLAALIFKKQKSIRNKQMKMEQKQKYFEEMEEVIVEPHFDTTYNQSEEEKKHLILKEHQKEGIQFMVNRLRKNRGCILGHSMGLGKTVQVIQTIHDMFILDKKIRRVLIVTPKSVIQNWYKEFHKYIEFNEFRRDTIYHIFAVEKLEEEKMIKRWEKCERGVLIISHRRWARIVKGEKNESSTSLEEGSSPHLLVVDEADVIRNADTKVTEALNSFKFSTRRRIAMTGYPLQNNLEELYHLVSFVTSGMSNPLISFEYFKQHYILEHNRYTKERKYNDVKALLIDIREKLKNVLHRKDESILTSELNIKMHDYVVALKVTPIQQENYRKIYELWMKHRSNCQNRSNFLLFFHLFSRLLNHPGALVKRYHKLLKSEDKEFGHTHKDDDDDEPVFDGIERNNFNVQKNILQNLCPSLENIQYQSSASSKFTFLIKLLKYCYQKDEKVLVFSSYVSTLDLLEDILQNTKKGGSSSMNWKKNNDFLRFDGSTNNRQQLIDRFNNDGNIKFMLLMKVAGGVGVNLTSASRVVLLDVHHNPSKDTQAAFRAYRYGQTKPVFVYRLVTSGTFEQVIYDNQLWKQSIFDYLIDKKDVQLKEMGKFEPGQYFLMNDIPESKKQSRDDLEDEFLKNFESDSLTTVELHQQEIL